MEGPRFLKKEEFPSLLKLMDTVFPGSAPHGENSSHNFTGREQDLEHHIVFEDNGEIVSHMGLFTREICVGTCVLKAGGVGSVATYEKYRGQGFMNKMFDAAFDIMKKEGFDLSLLGGDRKRYNSFGYEMGGRRLAFLITDRYVKNMKFDGLTAKKFTGDPAELSALKSIHEKEYFKTKRDDHYYDKLYNQKQKETFFALKNGKIVTYFTFVREGKEGFAWVYEYGGEATGLKFLLQHILAEQGIKKLNAVAPIVEHDLKQVFFETANNWYTEHNRIVKILDLKSTLTKCTAHMELSRKRCGAENSGVVTLVRGDGQSATLEIGKEVKVSDKKTANLLKLSDLDMVRLLFGLVRPSEAFKLAKEQLVLDSVLPLDCFAWLTDSV